MWFSYYLFTVPSLLSNSTKIYCDHSAAFEYTKSAYNGYSHFKHPTIPRNFFSQNGINVWKAQLQWVLLARAYFHEWIWPLLAAPSAIWIEKIKIYSMLKLNESPTILGRNKLFRFTYLFTRYTIIRALHLQTDINKKSGNFTQFVKLLSNQHENVPSFFFCLGNLTQISFSVTVPTPPTYYLNLYCCYIVVG